MAKRERGSLRQPLQHVTVTPLTGPESSIGELDKEKNVSRIKPKRDIGSFSSADDTYPAGDWTPWDCCQCAAQTRDAMLERVADAFGKYALVVYRHPKKFIVFSAMLCLGLSVGLLFKKSTTDGVLQYTIPNSQAQQDADEFRMLFQGNVTRSEILFIVANDGRSNLLERSFLNSVWDMHMRILDLKVTDEDDGDGLAAAAEAIAETGDTVQLPTRRLEGSLETFIDVNKPAIFELEAKEQNAEHRSHSLFAGRRLAWADPGAMVQQHLLQQQLTQQRQWTQGTSTPLVGRRRREAMAAAAQQQQQHQRQQLGTHLAERGEFCDPEMQLPRSRVTGLGCRSPLAPGEYGFANLCARDATGACEVPDGILFVYGHKNEFGTMVEYPTQTSFILARAFLTDLLLSRKGLRLTPSGRYATATAGLSIRQLTDDARLRPHALRWERKLLELLEKESLPGARIGVKTERSLSDELAASSSAGPGGEIMLVTAAGVLIGVYVWVVNFSRSHLRSKAVVGLTGAGAALLGYLGAFSPYLAIQSFCLICLAGLLLGYIMCLTFFLGFLALDARAEAARRVAGIFRCCPMGVLRDSAPVKTTGDATSHIRPEERRGVRTLKALPTLQYLDKTKLPGAEASALSACASDIFQCITMQVEAALQQQQQQRLIEAEAKRLRKQQNSKKARQRKTKGKTKKKKAASKEETSSDASSKEQSSESSGSDVSKPKRNTKKPKAKASPKKARKAKARPDKASLHKSSGKDTSTRESQPSKPTSSLTGSHRSSKKRQQRQRQRKAKALRPALKGRRQPVETVASTKATPPHESIHTTAKAAPEAVNEEKLNSSSDSKVNRKGSVVSVRLAKRRGTNVRFYKRSSTAAITASATLLQKQQSNKQGDDWKDKIVVELCVGSGSAVVAAAAEAAEAAFSTAGRSWSGERIARLQLLQRLGGGGLAEPQGNVGSGVRKVIVRFGARLLMNPFFKLMLLMVFASILITAVIGCLEIRTGLDPRSLTKEKTMLKRFFDLQEEYFGIYGEPVMVFFSYPENVCSAEFRVEYQKLHERLKEQPYTMELQDGLALFLQSPLGRNAPEQSATTCMQMLYAWLQTPFGSSFASFFSWSSGFRLRAWATVLVPKYFSTTQENSDFMHSLRADLAMFPLLKGATYNRNFVYFESDDAILPQTVSSMASAGCAVVIVSLFLLPSLRGALLVVGVLLLIDIVILGFMAWWGLPLNLLTMVNLTISIGFSVDYATHTTHAFCHCMGQKRGLRAFEAVLLVGGPLLHGALSTQLAVIPLAFVESPVLAVFFKMTTLVIIVGVTHGLLLLPVLLSLIGPLQQSHQKMIQQLLVLQQQYEQLEGQIIAAGGSRANPKLKQQRKALRRLIEQQQQPPETAASMNKGRACKMRAEQALPIHRKIPSVQTRVDQSPVKFSMCRLGVNFKGLKVAGSPRRLQTTGGNAVEQSAFFVSEYNLHTEFCRISPCSSATVQKLTSAEFASRGALMCGMRHFKQ
ncbi:hypothetical protein Efla_006380 [Eimeria flavescens]